MVTKTRSKFSQINGHYGILCVCVCVCVCALLICHATIISALWSFSNDSWHAILLWLCANTQRALIRCYFVRWTMATGTPLCHFLQEKMHSCRNSSGCLPQLLFFSLVLQIPPSARAAWEKSFYSSIRNSNKLTCALMTNSLSPLLPSWV